MRITTEKAEFRGITDALKGLPPMFTVARSRISRAYLRGYTTWKTTE